MAAIREEFTDEVYTITLDRPEMRNALDLNLMKSLGGALSNARNKKAQIVLLRGAGQSFSAGGDVFEVSRSSPAHIDSMADTLHRSIRLIRKMDAIVIAVLEGLTAGAGVGLALACDLTVADKKAYMNMGYRRLGLTPEGGGTFFLPRIIGAKKFNEFYLFSENIGMEEAKELGLVNFVWDETELDERLREMISALLCLPMETISRFKDLVNHSVYSGMELHLDRERFHVSQLGGKEQFRERIIAQCRMWEPPEKP